MNFPRDRHELQERWEDGESFKFYFFSFHMKPEAGLDDSCLSQWFDAGFDINGQHYPTAKHWMMAEKARLFGDLEILDAILKTSDPRKAKALGRKVRGFEQKVWTANRVGILIIGNIAKFRQNPDLNKFLQSTGEKVLVELAGRNAIVGIGLGKSHREDQNPRTWLGRNLLGFVLMEVREVIGGS
ncbi:NADAR family protein [Mariniblastus sp.]|nr:NADAR family protein [Mariniblastus sp.]